jgi:outer membrane receptor for ferrienterochelin and colicins
MQPSHVIRYAVLLILIHSLSVNADISRSNLYDLSLQELAQLDVTIATGNATPLDKAPSSASVIYARDIEAIGARTLDDVLQLVPGLHVGVSALSRLDSVYYFRGLHTGFNPQVLLMLNGVPIQNAVQGGRPTLFRLPVAGIDRIEVIRGPGSAVYGADAYAGVINVITKDISAMSNESLSVDLGSFNSQNYHFSGATQSNEMDISLVMTYQKTDGDSERRIAQDLQSILDQNLGTNASLAPGSLSTEYEVLDTHLTVQTPNWHLSLWHWTMDSGVGAGGAQALDPEGQQQGDIFRIDMGHEFQNLPSQWQSQIRTSFFKYKERVEFFLFPPGALLPIGADGNINFAQPNGMVSFTDGAIGNPAGSVDDRQLEWVNLYQGIESHRFRLALGLRYLSVDTKETKNFGPGVLDYSPLPAEMPGNLVDLNDTPYIFFEDNSRRVNYISLQDEWQLTRNLNLTAGIRYDDYSDFGHTTNPRLALIWTTSDSLVTKLMMGSAFRAPSFIELYGQNNPVSLGNEQLKPETIDTFEMSFNWQATNNLQTILTLFDYTAKDMMVFEDDINNISNTAQNSLTQDAQGFECELNWQLDDSWRLQGSYSHHNARNKQNHTDVADVPRSLGKLNVSYQATSDWHLTSQLFWVSDRKRRATDARDEIDDYALWNMNFQRTNIVKNVDFNLTLRNLLDKDIREPSSGEIAEDYPMESRGVWTGLDFSF